MQIVSNGDNLHEMSYPVLWKKYFNMSSAESFTRSTKRLILIILFLFIPLSIDMPVTNYPVANSVFNDYCIKSSAARY